MDYIYYTLGWIVYFAMHSILASSTAKKVLQATLIPANWYRLFYNTIAIVLLVSMVNWHLAMEKTFAFSQHCIGTSMGGFTLLFGIYIMALALKQYDLGEFSGTAYLKEIKLKDQLNTSGLNARVRHPIYLASLLVVWGLWLLFPSNALLVPTLVTSLYIPIGVYFEERKLLTVFGEEYASYKSEVPMIFPFKILKK